MGEPGGHAGPPLPRPGRPSVKPTGERWVPRARGRPVRGDLAAAGILLGLALLFIGPGLLPGQVWAPADIPLTEAPFRAGPLGRATAANPLLGDLVYQDLPWRLLAQRAFAAGTFPLWNDLSLHGYPFFGAGQPAVLYPLNLLWILFPVGAAAGWIAALKLWIAGLGMWAFLRRGLGLGAPAALLGAIGWTFCGPVVVWLGWPQTNVLVLLPWVCWATAAWCADGRRGALPALAALTAVAAFGGHVETLFNAGVTAGIWALALLVGRPARAALGRGAALVGAAGLGLALAAVQLVPFATQLLRSAAWAERGTGLQFAAFFPAAYLWTWLIPNFFGTPLAHLGTGTFNYNEQTVYIGILPLIGAALALVGAARGRVARRPVAAWAAVAALAGVLAYGPWLGALLRGLPLLARMPAIRWIAPGAFALLVLAAFGFDWASRGWGRVPRPRLVWGIAAALSGLGLVGMAAHGLGVLPAPALVRPLALFYGPYQRYWAIWGAAVGAASIGLVGLWALARRGNTRGRWAAPGVLALVLVADLWRMGYGYTPVRPAAELYPPDPLLARMAALPATPAPARVLVGGPAPRAGLNLAYGFADWAAQDPALPADAAAVAAVISPAEAADPALRYNMQFPDPRLDVAALLGLGYALLPDAADPNAGVPPVDGAPAFARLAAEGGLTLWANRAAAPFAYLAGPVTPVAGRGGGRCVAGGDDLGAGGRARGGDRGGRAGRARRRGGRRRGGPTVCGGRGGSAGDGGRAGLADRGAGLGPGLAGDGRRAARGDPSRAGAGAGDRGARGRACRGATLRTAGRGVGAGD